MIPNRYGSFTASAKGQAARAHGLRRLHLAPPPSGPPSYSTPAPYFGSREERARDDARERRAIDALYQQRARRAPRRGARRSSEMRRYTHYRVSEDEVVRERPSYARNDVRD